VAPWLSSLLRDARGRDAARVEDSLVCCGGVPLNLPEPGLQNYPHAVGEVVPSLRGSLCFDSLTSVMRSKVCRQVVFIEDLNEDSTGYTCDACYNLSRDENVRRVVERAWDGDLHSTHCKKDYLTMNQMTDKSMLHRQNLLRCNLALLGRDRRLKTLLRQRDLLKQLVTLLATNKIARVHALLARQLKRKVC
jgi:hypothetical protein